MKQIEFERWEPDAENPRRLTYAGQRTAEDVFHELEAQLDSVGYLPDEYFSMDWRWEHGRQIPKGADFFCKTDYGGSEGIYLSGGEMQRIAIARAMLKNAPVLILDEATAFADPDNEVKVQQALGELARGKTVIMIAHRLSTVANADRIFVLRDGKVIEDGRFDELKAQNGLFADMWSDYQKSVQWKVAKEA